MKRIRVELLVNLRCQKELLRKGTIFDAEEGRPLPPDIQAEVDCLKKGQLSNGVVRLLPVIQDDEEGRRKPGRPPKKLEPDSISAQAGGDTNQGDQ